MFGVPLCVAEETSFNDSHMCSSSTDGMTFFDVVFVFASVFFRSFGLSYVLPACE